MALASWFYRNVIHAERGPIVRLNARPIVGLGGQQAWEALAYLHPRLRPPSDKPVKIYGSCDGTGTDAARSVACHKAISEALERWAFYASLEAKSATTSLALDVDKSTTGFAAWPGWSGSTARAVAFFEAVERWSVLNWWEGHLSHARGQAGATSMITVRGPFPSAATVILWAATSAGSWAYGFAAGPSERLAIAKAQVELQRNISAILRTPKGAHTDTVLPLDEQRLLYFSGEEGHLKFQARLEKNVNPSTELPPVICDRKVSGPWDKYCRVWRVLFQPLAVETKEVDQFLF